MFLYSTLKLDLILRTDDPTAGAYGNKNFSYMEEYMVYEAKRSNRSVVFYGETAYWVNVDVDVPLFLPIYAQRRQHDLRRIAGREIKENFRIDGQMNFDSGVFNCQFSIVLDFNCEVFIFNNKVFNFYFLILSSISFEISRFSLIWRVSQYSF